MKKIISTEKAPAAIGPYSQAILSNNMVFTSGQLPLVPETMNFPDGGIKEQTRQSLSNLKEVLEKAGAGLETVVKTTCFLAKIEDFAAFNEVYSEFFNTGIHPARSCIQAGHLPKDALVEVEAIAHIRKPA